MTHILNLPSDDHSHIRPRFEASGLEKMFAKKYYDAGYRYIARNKDGDLNIFIDPPVRLELFRVWRVRAGYKRVDKRNFKWISYSDEYPVKLEDIFKEV